MPLSDSRLVGFSKKSVAERRDEVARLAGLGEEEKASWAAIGEVSEERADQIIENVVGTMSLPIGVATNFIIDGKAYLIPFVLEEPSVVAAASNMAKRCRRRGGFVSNCDDPVMIGQIQVVDIPNPDTAVEAVTAGKKELIDRCNAIDPILAQFGGGCRDISARLINTRSGIMLILHLLVDCRDAMGANAINSMAEGIAPLVSEITKGKVLLKIISNLAIHRLARVRAAFTPAEMSDSGEDAEQGRQVIDEIIRAYHFAEADPFRATTHNKGIMNAISAVALACGQDWRAIEAGAHSFAAYGRAAYGSLTTWEKRFDGDLIGSIELPMAVGLVGGAVRAHPAAKANISLLGVKTGKELAAIISAAGLAQNLGALRALATVGIQAGHMKLHERKSRL